MIPHGKHKDINVLIYAPCPGLTRPRVAVFCERDLGFSDSVSYIWLWLINYLCPSRLLGSTPVLTLRPAWRFDFDFGVVGALEWFGDVFWPHVTFCCTTVAQICWNESQRFSLTQDFFDWHLLTILKTSSASKCWGEMSVVAKLLEENVSQSLTETFELPERNVHEKFQSGLGSKKKKSTVVWSLIKSLKTKTQKFSLAVNCWSVPALEQWRHKWFKCQSRSLRTGVHKLSPSSFRMDVLGNITNKQEEAQSGFEPVFLFPLSLSGLISAACVCVRCRMNYLDGEFLPHFYLQEKPQIKDIFCEKGSAASRRWWFERLWEKLGRSLAEVWRTWSWPGSPPPFFFVWKKKKWCYNLSVKEQMNQIGFLFHILSACCQGFNIYWANLRVCVCVCLYLLIWCQCVETHCRDCDEMFLNARCHAEWAAHAALRKERTWYLTFDWAECCLMEDMKRSWF